MDKKMSSLLGPMDIILPLQAFVLPSSSACDTIIALAKVSRSIGDVYLKKPEFSSDPLFQQSVSFIPLKRPVITAEPSIRTHKLKPNDLFLIFASDGLWEQLNDEAAVDIVLKNPRAGIAKRLLRAALNEAARKREMRYDDIKRIGKGVRRHIHDDITVIVIYLDQHQPGGQSRLKSAYEYTSAPVDIFSLNSDESEDPLRPVRSEFVHDSCDVRGAGVACHLTL